MNFQQLNAQSERTGFRLSKRKLTTIALFCAYIFLFVSIYITWGTIYHYLGLSYSPESTVSLALAIILILGYAAFTPDKTNDFAAFFVQFQFIIVLVPSLLVISMQSPPSVLRITAIIFLFLAQLLLRAVASIKIRRVFKLPKGEGSNTFLYVTMSFCVLLLLYIVINYLPYMRLVALDAVHEHRQLVTEAVQIPFGGYILGFLQNAAAPLFIAVGIFSRRKFILFFGIALGILVYSIMGAKLALAQVLITIAFGMNAARHNRVNINFILAILVALLILVLLVLVSTSFEPQGIALTLVAIIFMRSFAIQGAMTGVYLDFFSDNPVTWYSHVNIINKLITYPYDAPLGFIIGNTMGGNWNFNANASFWATDGFAALGVFGVFVIAFIIAVFLLFTKLLIAEKLTPIAATASIPFIMALGNGSFFTNLITGGGIVLFLLIRLVSRLEKS